MNSVAGHRLTGYMDFMSSRCHFAHNAAAAAAIVAALAMPASAADSSSWLEDGPAALRLIAGTAARGADRLRAGIEIRLAPGWHTYWRYPGDAGVPPRFDFSDSRNLAAAQVSYPAPYLLTDEAGNSIGYEKGVVFPLLVTPKDASRPVKLHVVVDYAVCEKLCIPAQGTVELILDGGTSTAEPRLTAAEARVPNPASATEAGLSLKRVRTGNGQRPTVLVDVAAAGKPVVLFAEGPTPQWALPVPRAVDGAPGGLQRFSFELDGLPPGTDPNGTIPLVLTLVRDDRAFEVKTRLD